MLVYAPMEFLIDIFSDAIIDTVKLIPFLFVTYLIMEAIEQRAGNKAEEVVKQAGFAGPIVGSLVGAFPQCGFSAAASTLYAAKVITVGTLFSVYLATSDELLPILIAQQADPELIVKILGAKVCIGMLMGFIVDAFVRITSKGKEKHLHICDLCERDHCGCGHDHEDHFHNEHCHEHTHECKRDGKALNA
ncbi:MAG: putative manganese transporter, partial [Anaerotardibacter sp.]